MISHESLRPLIWAIKLGSYFQILPFHWDYSRKQIVLNSGCWSWRCFSIHAYTGLRTGIRKILYALLLALNLKYRESLEVTDVVFVVYFVCLWLLSIPVHILFHFWEDTLVSHTNMTLELRNLLGKHSLP